MNLQKNIEYIDMPEDLNGIYQSFTQADMSKLREQGYTKEFTSLENGVEKYIQSLQLDYLVKEAQKLNLGYGY
jgi:ADP-L-glycero-D-manno-heptose 6-epimerase